MLLVLAVLLALVVGIATGGRPANLGRLWIRAWPLLLVAVVLQAYFAGPVATGGGGLVSLRGVAFVATHILVLGVALVNWHLPGLRVVSLGAGANLVALIANGGYMPVSPEARVAVGHQASVDSLAVGSTVLGSKGIVLPFEQARLWFLTDIFALPPPFPLPAVFSVGDLLVALGLAYLIVHTMRSP